MSKSMDMIVIESINNFMAQHGVSPEKIIMNKRDYDLLIKGCNQWKWLDDSENLTELKMFNGVKIEVDKEITDWILVAPEHN